MPDVVIDASRVGPVALNGDEGESVVLNQRAGDPLAHAIKFRSPMRCLAEQHYARIPDSLQHRAELDGSMEVNASLDFAIACANAPSRAWTGRCPCGIHPSAPTNGTKRTSASSSVVYSCSLTRTTRISSCSRRSVPTGITNRPPIFSCDFKVSGTCGPPAATTIAS